MNKLLSFSLLMAGTSASLCASAQNLKAGEQNPQQPNIILFLVDDMGWQETSVPFYSEITPLNQRYKTPSMERMAREGVKFMEAYACAISSPTRCSLMSGMNAARHGVTNWTLNYGVNTDAGSSVISTPDWNYNGIQPAAYANDHDLDNGIAVTSMPQILQDNGYYTIHCGKAHFGSKTTTGANPLKFGFDVNIAGSAIGGPGSYLASNGYGEGGEFAVPGLEEYKKQGTFLTEALTQEALKALETPINDGQPFYLYMSHYAIHAPYEKDPRFSDHYNETDPMLGTRLNDAEIAHATLVEGMDKSLGDILDFLDAHEDVKNNTIVIFMADNGGQAIGRQGRENRDQNYPARAGKGSAYMGGVHEPMMLWWPSNEKLVPGSENNTRVMIEDFFPTILDLAGITEYKTAQTVDGKSFADILRDPSNESIERSRVNIWHFPNLWGESQDMSEGYGAYSAILKDDFHLIYFWQTQEKRLYNVKEDVGEQNNLASTMQDKVTELAKELTDSLKAYKAMRPTYKNGATIAWPDGTDGEEGETTQAFKYSSDTEKFVYRITDCRSKDTNVGTDFYWTLGSHNGYNAIQSNSEKHEGVYEAVDQYFYFMPSTEQNKFKMYTYDGRNIDYVNGLTGDAWNGGNIANDVTKPYMQYGTETSGDFRTEVTTYENEFAIYAPNGDMLNTRGTGNGTGANMKWVINTYQNNSTNDNGSRFKFIEVPKEEAGDVVVSYICDNNSKSFENLTNNYLTDITFTNGEQEKTKTFDAKPATLVTVLDDMKMDAKIGENVSVHLKAKNLGNYNELTEIKDLRYTAVILAIDWNRDGTFESVQKIKGKTPPTHNVGGNANPNEKDAYVMDFTYDITVGEEAIAGKTARVRVNYTNAWWAGENINNPRALATTCKEGIMYEFDIVVSEGTVTKYNVEVASANDEEGSVSIEGQTGTSVSVAKGTKLTLKAEANNNFMFDKWTVNDKVVGYRHTMEVDVTEDITYTAHFTEKGYPFMTRYFEVGYDQQNRYLASAGYKTGNKELVNIFNATTVEELPFNEYLEENITPSGTPKIRQREGAIVDKTKENSIVLEQGTTEFTMNFKQYNNNIELTDKNGEKVICEPELVWTEQVVYVDWNNDMVFEGENEIYETLGEPTSNNNFGDMNGSIENGWNRTISVPENIVAGNYRMRVVYIAWDFDMYPENLFTTYFGEIRNGIAYDFNIEITEPTGVESVKAATAYYNKETSSICNIRNAKVTVYDVAGNVVAETENTDRLSVSKLPEGAYFAKIGNSTLKFVR